MKSKMPQALAMATQPYWSIYARVFRDHRQAAAKTKDPACRKFCEETLEGLREAAIVYLPTEQVDAIPRIGKSFREEADAVYGLRPPFPTTFLAIGGTWSGYGENWGDTSLYAALIGDSEPVRVVPFFCGPEGITVGAGVGFVAVGEHVQEGKDEGLLVYSWVPDMPIPESQRPPGGFETTGRDAKESVAGGMTRALRALFLLESANVDIEPGEPAPASHRAGGRPTYEVVIRQTHRATVPAGGSVDWSHRWEVRGHFKHFRSGFMFDKHANRRVTRPDGSEAVRIWCPPHVKGPGDKPLVPKVRVLG